MSLIKRDTKSPTVGGVFANLRAASHNVVAPSGELFLILDRSGSMAGTPIDEPNRAARAVIDTYLSKVDITIIPFDGVKLMPAQTFVEMRVHGGTPMGQALAFFATHAKPLNHGILMSDGCPTDDPEPGIAACLAKQLVVHTVACGSGADDELLMDIAKRTGGTFYRATEPIQLTETFLAIGRKAVAALNEGRKELTK